MIERRNWNQDELTLALSLYAITPYSRISGSNPQIIKLAKTLGRSPGAVSYKLANFASLDKRTKEANKKGFSNGSKLDKLVWDKYTDNEGSLILPSLLTDSCQVMHSQKLSSEYLGIEDLSIKVPSESERIAKVRVRVNQSYFRQSVLANFNEVCVISGCRLTGLLEAAHILPWAEFEENRFELSNGLALNSLLHKLYDKNLLGISDSGEITVSKVVFKNNNIGLFNDFFLEINGSKINFEKARTQPNREFLFQRFGQFLEFNRNL